MSHWDDMVQLIHSQDPFHDSAYVIEAGPEVYAALMAERGNPEPADLRIDETPIVSVPYEVNAPLGWQIKYLGRRRREGM